MIFFRNASNRHDGSTTRSVLHGFAIFEASKGLLVLVVGLGLLSLIQHNLEVEAEDIVLFLNLNPAHKFPQIFINTLSHMEDPQLLLLSISALMYAVLRFIEAGGLWLDKVWAEWLAIIADSLFMPMEIFEIIMRVTVFRVMILLLNIAIVVFLLGVLLQRARARKRQIISSKSL
ncbi:MAG: DUF2127 domain-containing protein [Candidatus Latescibacterota bacterium]